MLRWFEDNGKDSDVVISSRVRLARNVKGYKFSYMLETEEETELKNTIMKKLDSVKSLNKYNSYDFDNLDIYQKMAMKERFVISDYLQQQEIAAGLVSPQEDISIMVNEEDHIRIQAYVAGMNINKAFTLVDKKDDEIGQVLDYAYNERYGYLTTCLSNVGTGMRASYMMHLPALSGNNRISGLVSEVGRFGLTLRAVEGDNNRALGDVYQLSNQVTLGKTEKEIMDNLSNIARQIVKQERNLRQQYIEQRRIQVQDLTYRSYGILKYARKVSLKDGMLLLSQLRLGLSTGLIKSVEDIGSSIYQLMIGIHPANLLMLSDRDCDAEQLDIARADFIRDNIPTIQ